MYLTRTWVPLAKKTAAIVNSGHSTSLVVADRRSLRTGGRCGQAVVADRRSLQTGGRCRQAVVADRRSLQTGSSFKARFMCLTCLKAES